MEYYTGTITRREEAEDLINFWDICYFDSEAKTLEVQDFDEDGDRVDDAEYLVKGEALDFLLNREKRRWKTVLERIRLLPL